MAGQLAHSWNFSLWERVGRLLAQGIPAPVEPRPAPPPRQVQLRLRPEQVDALVADYESGLSVGAVARKYGIHIDTATRHLNRRGVQIRPNRVNIPASELPNLLKLKAEGLNNVQIGQRYGCTRQAVQVALQRAIRARDAE